ncbi:PH domain-containing protein [Leifsonia sp. YAF41]|uniref:PH domain-containing protein n=1 Tax=Leifsonia sp. YAF41 TaxID=3233086 RepID=UPI003F944D05
MSEQVESKQVESDQVETQVESDQVAAARAAGTDRNVRIGADDAWKRVAPRYVVVEIVSTLLFGVIVCAIAAFVWLAMDLQWAVYVGAAVALITLVSLIVLPRRVRSIGYQLRQDDLLFRRGIMFQRFVSVPYGRMQLVDITRGPVARWLGLADLKFVTAAASSGVAIPGLAEADAEALRDRLVELAESRRAGL